MVAFIIVKENLNAFYFSVYKGGTTTDGAALALLLDVSSGIPDDIVEQSIRLSELSWLQQDKMVSFSFKLSLRRKRF